MRILIAAFWLCSLQAELPPKGITVSQWLREDYFSAYLGNDMAGFAKGEAKAKELLEANADNNEARGWWASGKLYLAARAYQAGRAGEGDALFAAARQESQRALARKDGAAVRTLGASFILLADRLPADKREALYREGRSLFAIVRQQEDAMLDKMPLHFKGEVLAAQAQAAMRLGLREEATKYLNEIVAKLPDTHYSQIAEKWLADPASAAKTQLVCQSCHEPNRLANRLKAIAAK